AHGHQSAGSRGRERPAIYPDQRHVGRRARRAPASPGRQPVSDPRLDELAESARNRGLKLVRSRVRTPGKRRFGKVGLTDAKGKPVFGMDAKGPTAKPEDAEEYLRNLGAKDWGASLDVAVLPKKRRPTRVARPAANDTEPEQQPTRVAPSPPPPKPKPAPPPP